MNHRPLTSNWWTVPCLPQAIHTENHTASWGEGSYKVSRQRTLDAAHKLLSRAVTMETQINVVWITDATTTNIWCWRYEWHQNSRPKIGCPPWRFQGVSPLQAMKIRKFLLLYKQTVFHSCVLFSYFLKCLTSLCVFRDTKENRVFHCKQYHFGQSFLKKKTPKTNLLFNTYTKVKTTHTVFFGVQFSVF